MSREELVKALRCCTSGASTAKCKANCVFYNGSDMGKCIPEMGRVVADAMENDQKHIGVLQACITELTKRNHRQSDTIGQLAKDRAWLMERVEKLEEDAE